MSEAEKKARLAEALRANLRRRKAQARAVSSLEETPVPAVPVDETRTDKD